MMSTKSHGDVDAFDRAYAFIERIDRLVDHREQDPVYDEGREILRDGRGLAKLCDERLRRLESLILGGDAADQFHEFHHRNRIHEMDADELLRSVGGSRKSRN